LGEWEIALGKFADSRGVVGMLHEQVIVNISSKGDPPFSPVMIEEEVARMPVISSSMLKKKRKGKQPTSWPQRSGRP